MSSAAAHERLGGEARRVANRAEQTRLYGAPLAEIFDELTEAFSLSRKGLARVLGLSAPMLSQLATAHRVKMGNPASVRRVQLLLGLLPELRAGGLSPQEALKAVESEDAGRVLTRMTDTSTARGAVSVRRLLRAVAPPDELRAAAALLGPDHPALARMLEVYGTGALEEAAEHYGAAVVRRSR